MILISFSALTFSQEKIESNIDYAYQNAKKGIYWALSNIPEKKSKIEENLVADDRLFTSVKLYKEVNGVRVESTGYYNTNEVTIVIYISNDTLEEYGYLKKYEKNEEKEEKK
jgi:hypothetical protein